MTSDNKGPWGQRPPGGGNGGGDEELERIIRQSQEKIKQLFPRGGNGGGSGGSGKSGGKGKKPLPTKTLVIIVLAVIGLFWLSTGIYTVDTKEQAVVLQFGKYVRTEGPGLQYHLPAPIERVLKVKVTDRYTDEIGYRAQTRRSKRGKSSSVEHDISMLTGDENIVDISFEVQWQITDAHKFLFNVYDPRGTVRKAAESAMREVIATTSINDILSENRTAAQLKTKELLQAIMDDYDSGITIEEINMKAVPPSSSITVDTLPTATDIKDGDLQPRRITTTVADAFKDVQAAINNKQEKINIAKGYANQQIPIARGEAQEILQQAEGYKQQVIADAQGEAKRFLAVYEQYRKAKNVTKKRMYLETMEAIMANMDKVIVDKTVGGNVLPYLSLEKTKK